ncbi:SpoIIE family protein phosphatase [Thermopolyspora sp. NPDC052614]|uniref:SpoIIE family protein phosphatase n=1 Tax=Thermopolyspora sp. NPDC052614 TaxID=3155682 RepID=UPI00341F4771
MDRWADIRSGDALFRLAFAQSPFALAVHDEHLVCLRISEHMARLFNIRPEDLIGRRLTDVLKGHQYDAMERHVRQVLQTGEPQVLHTFRRVPGEAREHAWTVLVSPLKDEEGRVRGVQVGALDFTEQYWTRQRLMLLNEASTSVGTTLDVSRTARELTDLVVPRFTDFASVDLLDSVLRGDEPSPGPVSGWVPLRRVAQRSIRVAVPEAAAEVGELTVYPDFSAPARALAAGVPILTGHHDPDFYRWIAADPVRAERVREYGFYSMMAVPMRARGITLGVVLFARLTHPEQFSQDDLFLAEELTSRAAFSVDNARRYSRERATAVALQRSLLPQRLPELSAVEVATRYLPTGSHVGVGGDWFDVIPLSGARVALVVGDVVGHGLHASATMGRLRTAVRTLADVDLPPDELLTRLDDLVARLSAEAGPAPGDDLGDVGASCVYAVYDPVSQCVTMARAGHPAPAIVAPDGIASFPDIPVGPPLGLGGLPFESVEMRLPEGSTLVLYTDGLIESRTHDIDVGQERLRRTVSNADPSPEVTADDVLAALLPDRPVDDVALLIARTRALNSDRVATWDIPADPSYVSEARKLATDQLERWGLDDAVFVTELIVSELVTNAIRHAAPPIHLRLIHDRALICEVSDNSGTVPHLRRARAMDEGGRGLLLVAQLTDRWGTRQSATGKIIWAEQTIHTPTRQPIPT